jgi:hypothetical protein
MAIDYSKAYSKLPRSRLKSNMDGEDTIVSYRDASPKARAGASPYQAPLSSRKGDRQSFKSDTVTAKGQRGLSPAAAPKPRGMAPQQKAAEARDARPVAKPSVASANTRKEDYPLKKGSTQPPAYKGVKGDTATKRGAVTSYQANGYTYTKNAQGNYQNFKAGSQPTKRKGSER